MRVWTMMAAAACLFGATASAQFQQGDPGGPKLGAAKVQRWRCGVEVEAVGGACSNLLAYVPFPMEWPEQDIKGIEDDIAPEAKVTYETVDGVKLMVVRIASLPAGQKTRAIVTFELRRSAILQPEDTAGYRLADAKKLDRKLSPYLLPSPKIESKDPKIRALARQIGTDQQKAWGKVEAIYDWVREKVTLKEGTVHGALAALKDGKGCHEDLTSLFIGICRAADIPARTVWVPGHCYAEFYLLDSEGNGHWFPCNPAGDRSFGGIGDQRPVMEKGDNFHPPWDKRRPVRFMPEHLEGQVTAGGGQPRWRTVREVLPQ
jgi:hypothetical protein